jgi:hypothetical protein
MSLAELQFIEKSIGERQDLEARGKGLEDIGSLNVLRPPNPIVESQEGQNFIGLGSGVYGGFKLGKDATRVFGMSPGAVIDGSVEVDSFCVIENVEFRNDGNSGVLLWLRSGARFRCNNCTFTKPTDLTSNYILVDDGAIGIFSSCTFIGRDPVPPQVVFLNNSTVAPANIELIGGLGPAMAVADWGNINLSASVP